MRFIGGFEFLIITGLCLCLLGPFVVGLVVRIWRGVNDSGERGDKP